MGSTFNDGRPKGWSTAWGLATDPGSGGYLSAPAGGPSHALSAAAAGGDVRVEADSGWERRARRVPRAPPGSSWPTRTENDDRYVELVHSVLPLAHGDGAVFQQTEFGKEAERPTATPPAPVFNGPMFGGPAAPTMWLRLAYHRDVANHENDVRMASSTDGRHSTWGGTWAMPYRGSLKIGLVSMNRPGATATFDYVHTFAARPRR